MERDALIANGMSHFLSESFLKRGDEYYMAVCNKTGMIAIYNETQNIFLSPLADGPIQFADGLEKDSFGMRIKNISRFGRSFSIVHIPYSLKLLIQELQTMNVVTRIITEENISQLLSLSYSDNFQNKIHSDPLSSLEDSIKSYIEKLRVEKLKSPEFNASQYIEERIVSDEIVQEVNEEPNSPPYSVSKSPPNSPPYSVPNSPPYSPPYSLQNSQEENPLMLPELKIPNDDSRSSPEYAPYSPAPLQERTGDSSPIDFLNSPSSPDYPPPPRVDAKYFSKIPPPRTPDYPPPNFVEKNKDVNDERITNLKNKIANLPPENQSVILEILKNNKSLTKSGDKDNGKKSIFDVEDINPDTSDVSDNKTIKHIDVGDKP